VTVRRRILRPETLIIILAVVLRFAALDLKPAHFDEGVNGWFADRIASQGYYDYDPTNYHGPLHMYAVFVSQQLFGRNLWALRLPAILASIAAVWMTLKFARFIGRDAARWAAVIMAVSPGFLFYGRYSIHESALVFFTMLTTWGIFAIWSTGERRGLAALAAGITGMILTKETYVIHLVSFALAFPCLLFYQRRSPSVPATPLARQQWSRRDVVVAVAASLGVIVFFYSGTFFDWRGLTGLYETFFAWFQTGVDQGGHVKADYQFGPINFYWPALMARYEFLYLLGLLACVRFLWPAPAALRYLAITGAGTLVAYTLIPYKTPWLIISMLWPFGLILGATIAEFSKYATVPRVAAILVGVSSLLAFRLNVLEFANPREPYVYVQTFPTIRKFTDPLLALAARDPAAYHLRGDIILDSYYPLPWMLGDFDNVGYYKDGLPGSGPADFVAIATSKAADFEATFTESYVRRPFRLRDAQEDCVAYFRVAVFGDLLKGEPTVGPR
jgi:uncharacterized protein (TIGR03663 family)